MWKLLHLPDDLPATMSDEEYRQAMGRATVIELTEEEILTLNGILLGRPGVAASIWLKLQGPVAVATRQAYGPDATGPVPGPVDAAPPTPPAGHTPPDRHDDRQAAYHSQAGAKPHAHQVNG